MPWWRVANRATVSARSANNPKKRFKVSGPDLILHHHRCHCRTALHSLPIVLKIGVSFAYPSRLCSSSHEPHAPFIVPSIASSYHGEMAFRHAAAQEVLRTGPRMEHLICRLQELAHVVTDESVLIHGDFRLGNVILDPLDDYNVVRPPTFRSFQGTDAFPKVHLSRHCVE
jgi:hypothetical protein